MHWPIRARQVGSEVRKSAPTLQARFCSWQANSLNANEMPRGFDENELANDFELYQQLRSIETRLSPLMHKLEDTIAAAGNDTYLDSLAVYGYAKSNDKGEGLENVVNNMKRYFKRRPRKIE